MKTLVIWNTFEGPAQFLWLEGDKSHLNDFVVRRVL